LEEVERFVDRVVELREGELVRNEPPRLLRAVAS
jgi:ABC-type multidrug transport system ATPase subunit